MDDPGAEREYLTEQHLALIRDFVDSRSLVAERRGQGRLFKFRFDAIPVDLISSIYQQFARSVAADEAASQGLHYTPVELVHLTLDPVFEQLPASARIIDPTCGSGAFLVEAFRRLVWRATQGRPANRKLVRKILYTQLLESTSIVQRLESRHSVSTSRRWNLMRSQSATSSTSSLIG